MHAVDPPPYIKEKQPVTIYLSSHSHEWFNDEWLFFLWEWTWEGVQENYVRLDS